jgi:hypothetical protein
VGLEGARLRKALDPQLMRALVHINCDGIAQVEFGRKSDSPSFNPAFESPRPFQTAGRRDQGAEQAQRRPDPRDHPR